MISSIAGRLDVVTPARGNLPASQVISHGGQERIIWQEERGSQDNKGNVADCSRGGSRVGRAACVALSGTRRLIVKGR